MLTTFSIDTPFSESAIESAKALGLSKSSVIQMLNSSAPYSSNGVNRRFEGYGFCVGDTAVHTIIKLPDSLYGWELIQAMRDTLAEIVIHDQKLVDLVGRGTAERAAALVHAADKQINNPEG